jgi:hypothetical protein
VRIMLTQLRFRSEMSLDRAHHLHTETSPRIYWRPYILTQEQKDRIDDQITQAKAEIDANEQGTTLTRRDSPDVYDEDDSNGKVSLDRGTESPASIKEDETKDE